MYATAALYRELEEVALASKEMPRTECLDENAFSGLVIAVGGTRFFSFR
jgi:hypothetical protein